MNRRLMTTLAIAAAAIVGFTQSPNVAIAQDKLPGAGKTVSPARPNWDSFWFGQRIVDIGMERLGYKVEAPKTLAPTAIFAAMAAGDIHYTADTILPNHSELYAKTEGKVIAIGPLMDPGTMQGYMVDKKSAEQHKIKYLEDMLDPKIAALFDQDGDGKADMIAPSVSWTGSAAVASLHMKSLGLEKTVKLVQGEYTTLAADAVGRYSAGKPIFLYTWYPNPTTMKLLPGKDLVWLELKTVELPGDQMKTYKPQPKVEGCANDPCNIGWLPTVYYIGVGKKWADENPAAVHLFRQIKMVLADRADQNKKMLAGENRDADIDRHARAWIKNHEAEFESWIKAAIAIAK